MNITQSTYKNSCIEALKYKFHSVVSIFLNLFTETILLNISLFLLYYIWFKFLIMTNSAWQNLTNQVYFEPFWDAESKSTIHFPPLALVFLLPNAISYVTIVSITNVWLCKVIISKDFILFSFITLNQTITLVILLHYHNMKIKCFS